MRSADIPQEKREAQALEGKRYAKARREVLGMSQSELAAELGISAKAIQRRENGRCQITQMSWLALCGLSQLQSLRSLSDFGITVSGPILESVGRWERMTDSGEGLNPRELVANMRESCEMQPSRWAGALGMSRQGVEKLESGKDGFTREIFLAALSVYLQVKFHTVDRCRTTHKVTAIKHFSN